MKSSRGQQLLNTFGALPGAHYAYYMSFQSSGSKKSNALNGARFGAEMKKLEPLEADHTKLKANFAGCEISLWLRNGVLQLAKFRNHLARLQNPLECFQIFGTDIFRFFCFRYLMSKSPFSPCNPPIIGFLSY